MEDILALVLIFGGGIVVALVFSPIGKAVADRIRGRTSDGAAEGSVESLREEVDQVRRELAELQERMDFTERLLAKQRTPQQVGPGPS